MTGTTTPVRPMTRGRAALRIHRLEYPFPAVYACHVLWGACFAMTSPGQLLAVPVLVTLLANLLGIISQNPLNAALDVRADTSTQGKGDIADATRLLGPRTAFRWAAAEMTLALGLSAAVSVWLARPAVVIGVALAIVLHLLYNLEPVRLKSRGYANPAYFGLTFALLPCVSTYSAIRPDIPVPVWLVFAGLAVLLFGRSLWWSIPDRTGDAVAGDRPPAVRHGARVALLVACAGTATALALIGWGLLWLYGPAWALLGVAACGAFLVDKLGLLRGISDENLPDETSMRRRSLSLVLAADLLLVVIPVILVIAR
ncbi:UbiA prenyltransferase family protein [Streptosporangium sp. H16]|uniref:UbiA prenyltransferase family protein n=1 Tax=Streptosporangium sp. H16 TaxID=3444184 RepID=UPI003F79FD9F